MRSSAASTQRSRASARSSRQVQWLSVSEFRSYSRSATRAPAGMDVGHPSPGVATRPSVTSLVASVNWDCTQYVAFCGVQQPREEMIQNLEEMLTVRPPPPFSPRHVLRSVLECHDAVRAALERQLSCQRHLLPRRRLRGRI